MIIFFLSKSFFITYHVCSLKPLQIFNLIVNLNTKFRTSNLDSRISNLVFQISNLKWALGPFVEINIFNTQLLEEESLKIYAQMDRTCCEVEVVFVSIIQIQCTLLSVHTQVSGYYTQIQTFSLATFNCLWLYRLRNNFQFCPNLCFSFII